ncbi:tyrosine-protein phosphatase non-receptor type 22 [Odontesthes bonariensis]|uniref:tyrosine-protein phosphatase non-receptor type 22 n=1 Tax=Odontesthes bonariensis TaxID=219752 RepID=UPI003F584998
MEQQARILRSILTHLERQETLDEVASDCIAGEFERLKKQSMKYRMDKTFPTKTAEKQENVKKNRYKDIVPFDHSRVKLTFTTSKNDTDYINASFIKGVSGSRAYVATQGPLPHTVVDFFRMLWEYKIEVIVMACREFEMGKKKCELYWPQKQEETFVCKPFTVHCESEENKGDYVTRTLRLTYCNCSRTLKQLHYVNWPDHGVPDTIPPIMDMLHEMRIYQDHDGIPICIHCSAGCGRTGALCAIDYTWNLLRKQMITSDFNIYHLVQDMRTQRPSVVQTKEQYLLVYRTIKLLFQRYLHSMDAHTYQNEATMVPSTITAVSERELFDLSEESDLKPQQQCLLEEERPVLPQNTTPVTYALENLISLRAKDMQWDKQQCQALHSIPEALTTHKSLNNEGPNMSPKLLHNRQTIPAVENRMQESDNMPPLNPEPPAAVAEAICHMVEDPYFDKPTSSPSSEEAPVNPTESMEWTLSPVFTTPSLLLNDKTLELNSPASGTAEVLINEEVPPPVPERTPESYILALDAELSDPCERLSVIIPPNAAAEAVRDLGGSPPSPVPPLPERTPESFELATDPAPVELQVGLMPAANLDVIGMSSEWSGNSAPAAAASQNERTSHVRSKSLRAKMTFSAPVIQFNLQPSATSNPHNFHPALEPSAPPLHLQTVDSLTQSFPERNRKSFILTTEDVHERSVPCSHRSGTTNPSPMVGKSSEWDGTSQPKKILDVFTRSKSVRAKSSRQEPLTSFQQLAPLPVAGGGSAQVEQNDGNHRPPLNTDRSGNKSDKSNEKGLSRAKSLKFFKTKQKPKTDPPPPPTQPGTPQTLSGSSAVFKFGFGNRFGKPKGPRTYPETWV